MQSAIFSCCLKADAKKEAGKNIRQELNLDSPLIIPDKLCIMSSQIVPFRHLTVQVHRNEVSF